MLRVSISKPLHGISGNMKLSVDMQIKIGSFVAITGKSGSGKTTLLRILAGLDDAKGYISVDDKVWLDDLWLDAAYKLPSQKREIGFVFQDYALFANMNVENNLLYVSKDPVLAMELMKLTGIYALRMHKPDSLSGGQKQRVALCRAMMSRPKLLLMDEPLSALDMGMRDKLQRDILALHRRFGTTTIMVSHDPREIYLMADRVIVLDGGSVVTDGTPRDTLLHTLGSQKFSFVGEILEIVQADVICVAIMAIGQQIVEVVVSKNEAENLNIGDRVDISTKAFAPTLSINRNDA